MKTLSLLVVLAACNAGDDTTDGARALCAQGGALNSCPDQQPTTAEGACWKLVDCAAIALDTMNGFDWGDCVDYIMRRTDDRQRLIIDCIGASSCDALKPDPQNGNIGCLLLGDQQ